MRQTNEREDQGKGPAETCVVKKTREKIGGHRNVKLTMDERNISARGE